MLYKVTLVAVGRLDCGRWSRVNTETTSEANTVSHGKKWPPGQEWPQKKCKEAIHVCIPKGEPRHELKWGSPTERA